MGGNVRFIFLKNEDYKIFIYFIMLNTKAWRSKKWRKQQSSDNWHKDQKNSTQNPYYNHSMSAKMRKTYVQEDASGNYDGQNSKISRTKIYHRSRTGSASRLVSSRGSRAVSTSRNGKVLSKSAQNIGSMDRLRRLNFLEFMFIVNKVK